MIELLLGGNRSGKSQLAENLANRSNLAVTYIATAATADSGLDCNVDVSLDVEMRDRIERHQQRRPVDWTTIEEPIQLAKTLAEHASFDKCILVDCLTLWLSNLLALDVKQKEQHILQLLNLLPQLNGHIIFVSNEVGLGIIPSNALARQFCDEAGKLHQSIATHCQRVILTVAGCPLVIKGESL